MGYDLQEVGNGIEIIQLKNCYYIYAHCTADYFRGGNISRMPSGAIIHEENFHECMAHFS